MRASRVSEPLSLRVTVSDGWVTVPVTVPASAPVAEVKRRALDAATIGARAEARYEVKHGGALLADESRTLQAAGVRDGAALVVVPRRRRPVR